MTISDGEQSDLLDAPGRGWLTRTEYHPGPGIGVWDVDQENLEWTGSCAPPPSEKMFGYPRIHMLSTQEALQTAGHAPEINPLKSGRFLELNANNYLCSTARWKLGDVPNEPHRYGNSVHFITWDATTGYNEVVYLIGGADSGQTASVPVCTGFVNATVEKLVNPTITASWDTGAPNLNSPRANQNAVILLDGSIMVVGGVTTRTGPQQDECVGAVLPELYKTFEVFGDPNAVWQEMTSQVTDRRYHSVAGLLPDGRVFSAGGREPNLPDAHTLQIFSPPYFFQGTRPVIDETMLQDPVTNPYRYSDLTMTFEVTLAPGVQVDRVALIRNGSSTHAFDPDQRYVELQIEAPLEVEPNNWSVTAYLPPDAYYAPEGYYILTVTDSNQRPSTGEWIRISQ